MVACGRDIGLQADGIVAAARSATTPVQPPGGQARAPRSPWHSMRVTGVSSGKTLSEIGVVRASISPRSGVSSEPTRLRRRSLQSSLEPVSA